VGLENAISANPGPTLGRFRATERNAALPEVIQEEAASLLFGGVSLRCELHLPITGELYVTTKELRELHSNSVMEGSES
jgi:hypothetical protein